MVGDDQDARGEGDPPGHGGEERHQVERVGDPAVVGQRHPSRRRIGIGAGVVGDDHGVLDHHHALEPARLGVAGEPGHPVGVGGHSGADRRDDAELHGCSSVAGGCGSGGTERVADAGPAGLAPIRPAVSRRAYAGASARHGRRTVSAHLHRRQRDGSLDGLPSPVAGSWGLHDPQGRGPAGAGDDGTTPHEQRRLLERRKRTGRQPGSAVLRGVVRSGGGTPDPDPRMNRRRFLAWSAVGGAAAAVALRRGRCRRARSTRALRCHDVRGIPGPVRREGPAGFRRRHRDRRGDPAHLPGDHRGEHAGPGTPGGSPPPQRPETSRGTPMR